jgi:hypothetical protein
MSQVFEQFEFTIGSFGQDRCAEWFHDFLDGNRLACQLVLCRTTQFRPSHTTGKYHTSPNAPIPTGWRSTYLAQSQHRCLSGAQSQLGEITRSEHGAARYGLYRLVISKQVPKICARTNSAMIGGEEGFGGPWSSDGWRRQRGTVPGAQVCGSQPVGSVNISSQRNPIWVYDVTP